MNRRQAGTVAIIPARGGSKRIPGKALIDFEGQPLLNWTVQAALESGEFDRVWLSTDDPRIAEAGVAAGAEVPFLRTEHADDDAPASAATVWTIQELERRGETIPDTVAHLLVTSPLRTADDLRHALAEFRTGDAAFQLSCFEYTGATPWWARRLDEHGRATRIFPGPMVRSQDLEAIYCPSGAVWLARTDPLLEAGTFYGPDHVMLPLPDWRSGIELDTPQDLDLLRALYRYRATQAS